MCELMALSYTRPSAAGEAVGSFGGCGEENPHGWGLAWYSGRSLAMLKEPVKWHSSLHSAFLQTYVGLRSHLYIAHVRDKSIGGEPTHADTHPFGRELLGREYCFAHNGTVAGAFNDLSLGRFRPVGSTDSEHIFCHLLGELDAAGGSLATPEHWRWLHAKLIAANTLGELNCLLSDGERLFCYHDAVGYKGLHLCRVAGEDDGQQAGYLIATRATGDRAWDAFQPGELVVFEAGELLFSSRSSIQNPEMRKA